MVWGSAVSSLASHVQWQEVNWFRWDRWWFSSYGLLKNVIVVYGNNFLKCYITGYITGRNLGFYTQAHVAKGKHSRWEKKTEKSPKLRAGRLPTHLELSMAMENKQGIHHNISIEDKEVSQIEPSTAGARIDLFISFLHGKQFQGAPLRWKGEVWCCQK